jgi:Domain of unknown function (DUF4383)
MSLTMALYSYVSKGRSDQPRRIIHERRFRVEERAPAQVFALAIGLTLVIAGIAGFFYSASFTTGDDVRREALIGILDVNGWHNVFHIATGVLGLAAAGSYGAARGYAIGAGALYLLAAALGFLAGDGGEIAGLIPVSTEDNVFHLLIAVAGLGAGLATPTVEPARVSPP